MKLKEIEKKFGDYINSKEDTQVDFELDNLLNSKVWPQIEDRVTTQKSIRPYWWAAASIIGIIMAFGASYSYTVKQKNEKIAHLESELANMNNSKDKLFQQVRQMQYKLEIAQSNLQKPKTIYRTKIAYINSNPNSPLAIKQATDGSGADSSKYLVTQPKNMEKPTVKNEENNLTDSLKTNELEELDKFLAQNKENQASEKKIFQYKINYGEMKTDAERSWKLTMTFQ
jgi:hypothetical protein